MSSSNKKSNDAKKDAVHQKAADIARGIPVLGDAIDIGQKVGYIGHLGKLFGRKKDKKEE